MAEIDPNQWNAMVKDNYPFIRHEFLHALEKHQCVSAKFGWLPNHITVYQNSTLIAALPLYEKHNNYGEFVFDQAWEQAWNQIGLAYYPKLVSAIPYSPVMGPRFLLSETLSEADQESVFQQLYSTLCEFCETKGMSGVHILFANPKQQQQLQQLKDAHLYSRLGFQFHWQNQNYHNFADFLAQLRPKKRKNIQRERRAVADSGVTFRVLNGHQASDEDWHDFDYFYQKTFLEKWSTPTLNVGFFKEIGKTLPDNIVLVLADLNDTCIAGALMLQSDTHLYGRHWGAAEHVKNLHFEACYYQGIEYAIANKLQTFEPGAGGEHKIARGFTAVEIHSFHWLAINPFGENLDHFIEEEAKAVRHYLNADENKSPYKNAHDAS